MTDKYKFAAYAVDLAIYTMDLDTLKVLTVKMDKEPYKGKMALPGSLVDPGTEIEDTIKNITGKAFRKAHIEQVKTFGRPDRDPNGRVVSTLYMVLVRREHMALIETEVQGHMKKRTAWINPDNINHNAFAYDHTEMLVASLERLRNKTRYSTIVSALMPETFTLYDLRRAYEAILGTHIDKRNFIRHINTSSVLRETDEVERSRKTRPAAKYAFASKVITIISRM